MQTAALGYGVSTMTQREAVTSPVALLLLGTPSDIATEWVARLRRSGGEVALTRVESLSELRQCVRDADWDFILCSTEFPKLSLAHISAILRKEGRTIPFLSLGGYSPKQVVRAPDASDTVADLILEEDPPAPGRIQRGPRQSQAAARATAETSEERFARIADLAPIPIWKTDASGKTIFFNRYCREFCESPDDKSDPNSPAPENGFARQPVLSAALTKNVPFAAELQLRRWDGAERVYFATGAPQFDQRDQLIGYLNAGCDITDQKPWAAELQLEARLLDSLAHATCAIASCTNPLHCGCAPDVLKTLGTALDADRAYIFRNRVHEKGYATLTDQLYEWNSEHAPPISGTPNYNDDAFGVVFDRLFRNIRNGLPFSALVKDLSPEARAVLNPQNIRSILCVPILASNNLWGFIGFDDCRRDRVWLQSEIALVQAIAGAFSALLDRQSAQQAIHSRDQLLRYIAQTTHELLTTPTLEGAIKRSLHLLGAAANVDRTWLLQNTDADPKSPLAVTVYEYWSLHPIVTRPPGAAIAYDDMLPGSYELLEAGHTVRGIVADLLTPREANALPPLRRILLAPVISGSRFWGIIGISTTDLNGAWETGEEDLLKAAASSIGAAIARRAAETALREREEYYRSIIENVSDIIAIIDGQGVLTYASPALETALGYAPADILNHNVEELLHPDDAYNLIQVRRVIIEDPSTIRTVEFRLRHRDGSWRDFESATKVLHIQGRRRHYVINARDITERKKSELALRRSEELLQHSQKMEAVGRLAGGIAHDFNNLLTVITGYAEVLREEIPADQPLHRDAEEIAKAAERAFGLTRQLLAFSRKQVLEPKLHDLNTIVRNLQNILRRLISEDIEIATDLAPEPGLVRIDAGQMEQVVINLALNARDAMPNGGRLSIRTSRQDLSSRLTRGTLSVEPGPYTVLDVTDNGKGIDPTIMPRIFEPFFTTKEVGKGTGLGLPMVYGIMQQSGGSVLVESTPGRGTTFSLYLPRVDGRPTPASHSPQTEVVRGSESILLVEDEENVRKLTAQLLGQFGYRVTTASNGREALEVATQKKHAFQLLLTDIIMPHISGPSLAEQLRNKVPNLKVLYMSGYADEALSGMTDVEPGRNFLQKPFKPAALAALVREVLDAR